VRPRRLVMARMVNCMSMNWGRLYEASSDCWCEEERLAVKWLAVDEVIVGLLMTLL
jgi:hypothetical protein